MSWTSCVRSQEAKVLPHIFKRFNLHGGTALMFSAQEEKRHKEGVTVYTWQQLYVATCGFCRQITVISPSELEMEEGFVFCFLSV